MITLTVIKISSAYCIYYFLVLGETALVTPAANVLAKEDLPAEIVRQGEF
jgi:hypothetical protein